MSGIKTSKEGKALDEAFNARHEAMNRVLGKPDNRSSWWSIGDLENYIAHAKAQAIELGYTLNGIRAYTGAEVVAGKQGYTTIFLAPTGSSNGNKTNGNGDIPEGDILNAGVDGEPPNANYPQ